MGQAAAFLCDPMAVGVPQLTRKGCIKTACVAIAVCLKSYHQETIEVLLFVSPASSTYTYVYD